MEYNRKCKCCKEEFVTNRIDQYFLNRLHQVSFNNAKQSKERERLAFINKPLMKTYRIYKKILNNLSETVSKEFLKGRGADLALFNNVQFVDGAFQQCLFDIAIVDKGEMVTLKKVRHD
jgi:hypothetical protein